MRYKEMVRWGAERIAFQSQIAKQVEALARLRFDIVKFPAWDPKRKTWNPDGITLSGDRVIDIVDTACIGNKKKREETDDHFWSIRFGQWASSWVNAHGKVWLGPMPRQVITYDHRQNRASAVLAKKVAVNSVMLWGAARGRAFLDRRIDHLLESVGELPEPEQRGPHWAGRTFDRMSEAGLMLSESGVLKLTYEGGECVPQSFDRYKGWVKDWLGSKMRIERPAYFKSG